MWGLSGNLTTWHRDFKLGAQGLRMTPTRWGPPGAACQCCTTHPSKSRPGTSRFLTRACVLTTTGSRHWHLTGTCRLSVIPTRTHSHRLGGSSGQGSWGSEQRHAIMNDCSYCQAELECPAMTSPCIVTVPAVLVTSARVKGMERVEGSYQAGDSEFRLKVTMDSWLRLSLRVEVSFLSPLSQLALQPVPKPAICSRTKSWMFW